MLHGSGNAVPSGQARRDAESDGESYTGSSGSYSETASQHDQHQQQQQKPAATPQSASKSQRNDHARAAQSTPAADRQAAPQHFDEGEEDGEGGKKTHGAKGKEKARQMVNAALNAPAARMRAVSASLAGRDSQRVTVYVFLIVALVHLLFVILSCTLSQIDVQGGGCYTYWGYKARCDDVSYTTRTALINDCGQLRSTLQAGAAFSILSILTSTALVVAAWMMCGRLRHANYVARHQNRYRNVDAGSLRAEGGQQQEGDAKEQAFKPGQLKLVTIIIVAISLACELIAWAMIAGVETQHYCDAKYQFSKFGTYGVGFGLSLTAWIIEILVFIVYVTVV